VLAGLLTACVLGLALLVVRAKTDPAAAALRSAWTPSVRQHRHWLFGAAAIVLSAPLGLAIFRPGQRLMLPGDSFTHAHVGLDLARHGLGHGWIATYMGGFPLGHHYPPVGFFLTALLVRTGASPEAAVMALGLLATAASPVVVYAVAVHAGARPPIALAGAAVVAWMVPYNSFVGGYEAFLQTGLLSQVLAIPLCILCAGTAAAGRSRMVPALAAAAAMATHPQLTVAMLIVLGAALACSARRAAINGGLRAAGAAFAMGAALYGQGIGTLGIPFGWPARFGWLRFGFPPERLKWWIFDGDLLDFGRAPVMTSLVAGALVALVLLVRRPAARATLVALSCSVLLSVSGRWLSTTGALGESVLAAVQPLRVVAIIPLAAAAALVVALQEGCRLLRAATTGASRPHAGRFVAMALPIAAIGIATVGLPARVTAARNDQSDRFASTATPCGPLTPAGYDSAAEKRLLGSLRGGRLFWSTNDQALLACTAGDGLELASSVAIGVTDGVGAHVGMIWTAAHALDPSRAGSAERAESLGVRWLLDQDSGPLPGWHTVDDAHGFRLSAHEGRTDVIGAGCVRELWAGGNRQLEQSLHDAFADPAMTDRLLDPVNLTEIRITRGHVEKAPADAGNECDPTGTVIREVGREPGALEASVTAPHAVDLVLRVTQLRSWHATVDGIALPAKMVAPGFFAVRIPKGEHHLVAVGGTLPGYPGALMAGILGVLACGILRFPPRRSPG
jgi:hypothetical protein